MSEEVLAAMIVLARERAVADRQRAAGTSRARELVARLEEWR